MNNIENIKIVVSLLKRHHIKYVVASPGGTNIALVTAFQNDSYFRCFSVVDERSAVYFAIGLYLETGETIALSCTSAQATRNYIPGLTEAYYKHAPLLAITMSKLPRFTYQDYMQAPNQTSLPVDCVKRSFSLPVVQCTSDYLESSRLVNEAILEVSHNGKGPVQLNIPWQDFDIKPIKDSEPKMIIRYDNITDTDYLDGKKIMVVAGEHPPYSSEFVNALNDFCESHNAMVYINHLSNLHTPYTIEGNLYLSTNPEDKVLEKLMPDVLISIGGQTGDYPFYRTFSRTEFKFEHWAINDEGRAVDTYDKLSRIYQMDAEMFFRLARGSSKYAHDFLYVWKEKTQVYNYDVDLPFSNVYAAQLLHDMIPSNSTVNFAILNSLRTWDLFPLHESIKCFSNVAAFGIDGCTSMLLGQSVMSDQTHFLITGDLAFFYDLNSLGIRHIKNNVRILLINNNGGVEFKLYSKNEEQNLQKDQFIAAANHFKNAKGWAQTCGFEYISATDKKEFEARIALFVGESSKPIVFEIFTKDLDEALAYKYIIEANKTSSAKGILRKAYRSIVKK